MRETYLCDISMISLGIYLSRGRERFLSEQADRKEHRIDHGLMQQIDQEGMFSEKGKRAARRCEPRALRCRFQTFQDTAALQKPEQEIAGNIQEDPWEQGK
jgi:hypothetical protein